MTLIVELGPAEDSQDRSEQQHRVEEDESGDGRVRILAEHHKSHQPDPRAAELELLGGIVGERDTQDTKQGVEGAHEGVVDLLRVLLARLEFEGSVVAGQDSGETDQHLAEGRVDIEVVFVLDVVAAELAKVSLVPGHDVADANLP